MRPDAICTLSSKAGPWAKAWLLHYSASSSTRVCSISRRQHRCQLGKRLGIRGTPSDSSTCCAWVAVWSAPATSRVTINVFEFSLKRPLEHLPNPVGRYRNGDPLILGALIKRTVVEHLGEAYLSWPQHALLARLGMRRQVMETDSYGNFILSGYDYGTARNWARLGLLYAQDGVWNGARLLPEGYAQLGGTPAPAWREPEYGGQFWVNGTGKYPIPRDAYYMAGVCDQRVFIIPSHDLVVVRLGHRRGSEPGKADLDTALSQLIAAVEAA
jgi:CubicO group peptidase (beta-lactamase class C family)